jgi:hypothetical protein
MAARRAGRGEGAPGSMAPHGEGKGTGHEAMGGPGGRMGGHGPMGRHMGGHMGAGGPGAFLERFDTNHDGVVTEAEFMARAEARFMHADRNGDGVIDAKDHEGHRGHDGHDGHDGGAAPR